MTDVPASAVRRPPVGIRALAEQLLAHMRLPLHRDGYALALNSAFTAATGLLYWMLAAHSYSPQSVGINSALISSMMFLAGIACLNLPSVLVRFLPQSGHRSRRRIVCSYALAVAAAMCAATIFIVGTGAWAPRLSFLASDRGLQLWFVFSTLAWSLFMIQDGVLTALGRAILVPVENAVFSILKLGLLALLAASLPVYGIFVSWTIAVLVSVLGVNLVVFARLMRRLPGGTAEPRLSMRDRSFARYFAGDYACSVAWLSATNLMPVIVITVAGATASAYYGLAYAVVLPIYAVAQNIGTSLTLHGAGDPDALSSLTRKAARQGLRVLLPCSCVLVLTAPYLLSLFGPTYAAHGATVLRLLALGVVPYFVLSLALSVARVRRRLRRVVIALALEAILALGLAVPLLHAFGVTGAAVAWLVSLIVIAAGLLVTRKRSFGA
jgi:O-antigen/teichoic acid export membrane protein